MRSCRDCGWCGVVLMVVLWAACGGNVDGLSELGMGPLGSMDSEAPTLTEVTPALGPSTGGTMVTISGEHFGSGAKVYVAGLEATQVAILSGTRLTAVIPAHLGFRGPVSVTVKNPDGQQGQRGDLFSYYFGRTSFGVRTFPQDPSISSLVEADFNGDGKPDLALLNAVPSSVTVLLGDDNGGFESTTYPVLVNDFPGPMVAGDLKQTTTCGPRGPG
jgi:hypothetical protein